MDLGSALMSAEMARRDGAATTCGCVLVGGAARRGRRRGGRGGRGSARALDEVAAEARGALRAKAEQLGEEAAGGAPDDAGAAGAGGGLGEGADVEELRVVVGNRLGLHARPAARFVGAAAGADAQVEVVQRDDGPRARPARGSLTALATLGVRQGHEILVRARGPEARRALDAIQALADDNFGDDDGDGAGRGRERRRGARAAGRGRGAARARRARCRGLPAAPGVAIGPAPAPAASPSRSISDAPAGDPADEWRALDAARDAARADVSRGPRRRSPPAPARPRPRSSTPTLLLLDDDALLEPARRAIDDEGRNAAPGVGRRRRGRRRRVRDAGRRRTCGARRRRARRRPPRARPPRRRPARGRRPSRARACSSPTT